MVSLPAVHSHQQQRQGGSEKGKKGRGRGEKHGDSHHQHGHHKGRRDDAQDSTGFLPSIGGSSKKAKCKAPREKPREGVPTRKIRMEMSHGQSDLFSTADSEVESKRRKGGGGSSWKSQAGREERSSMSKDGGLPMLPLSVYYGRDSMKYSTKLPSASSSLASISSAVPIVSRAYHRLDVNDRTPFSNITQHPVRDGNIVSLPSIAAR
eukprot:CAMPEP_0113879540 /NCGR_PEP_ID=MMETSP0780_2-20120614/7292_1 /TAXON_ID=652834 /ORGANISM="Palpitomonas bilix" /LENGTH=207 /DNA_ID=CAMNT_0000866127 /DNA_START=282 /DNA_END=905 /DNA_ORIENTATION=+ /assembly_acc=CAM_ASM_000599